MEQVAKMTVKKKSADVNQRAKKIRLLLMDVDGVLTNGSVCLQTFPDGSVAEMKVFNAHDRAGLAGGCLLRCRGCGHGLILAPRPGAAMGRGLAAPLTAPPGRGQFRVGSRRPLGFAPKAPHWQEKIGGDQRDS